jgi:anti-sigma factor RsiW
MNCNEARDRLALGERDTQLEEHMGSCPSCARYGQRQHALDSALRPEMMMAAPAELTLRLLMLVPGGAPARVAPRRWYVRLVYTLTVAAIGVSLAVAVQLYALLAVQLGLPDALGALRQAPADGLSWLYATLPPSRYIVPSLLAVRDQLHWVLLALLGWAALDRSYARQAADSYS